MRIYRKTIHNLSFWNLHLRMENHFFTVIIDHPEHKSKPYAQEGGDVSLNNKRDHSLTLIRLIQTLISLAS